MSEEIKKLYNLFFTAPNEEIRNAVTAKLLELFKEPSTIIILFQIINEPVDNTLRQLAALNLRNCISNCWKDELSHKDNGEIVKKTLLETLAKEQNLLIAKNIIESCEILFECEFENSQQNPWNDVFPFLQNCSQSFIGLSIAYYFITNAARFMGSTVIDQNYQVFMSLLSPGMNSDNIELVASAMEMLGVIISFVSPELINQCTPQLEYMLQTFHKFLQSNNSSLLRKVSYSIADSFQCDVLPISAIEILKVLLSFLSDQSIPSHNYIDIFLPIQHLIKFHALELSDMVNQIISATLAACTATFNDSFYVDNCDMTIIASVIGDLAGELQMPTFLQILRSFEEQSTANEVSLLSYALVFYNAIDECNEEMHNNIQPIVHTTINLLNCPSLYIKEVGVLISAIIADNLELSQINLATLLLKSLMPILELGNEYLVLPTFDSIITLFNQSLLESDLIETVLNGMIAILQNPNANLYHHLAIEAISAITFAAEEDIAPYTSQIFQLVVQAATLSSNDPSILIIRQQGIIAIGMILRFGARLSEQDTIQALELIFSNANPDDFEMVHSILFALGNLVIAHFPILVNYRNQIIQLIDYNLQYLVNHIINYDDINNDEEKEAMIFNSSIRGFTDTLYLIKWIFKEYNELAPESPTQWMATILTFMKAPLEELQSCSIVAGYYGTAMIMKTHASDSKLFLEPMMELFNSPFSKVVGKCFAAFNYFIKNHVPIDDRFIAGALEAGFLAISGNLPYQKSKSLDFHDSKNVYKFFGSLSQATGQNFPIQKYVQLGKKLLSSNRQLYEIFQYIDALNMIYKLNHDHIQTLTKKVLMKTFRDSFQIFTEVISEETDDYSPFSIPPSPIYSMSLIMMFEPNFISDIYKNILEIMHKILVFPPSNERFYNATISNAIEFLCVILQKSPDAFDFQNIFPLILPKLPLKLMGDEHLSDHIYFTLLTSLQNNDIFKQFGGEFLRILVQTLGIKDHHFSNFKFSQETIRTILTSVSNLISGFGESLESMKRFFTYEQSFQRFVSRMSSMNV